MKAGAGGSSQKAEARSQLEAVIRPALLVSCRSPQRQIGVACFSQPKPGLPHPEEES
jgi:hypothetical protein